MLLMVFCFVRGIRVAHRFLGGVSCCLSFFVLGGGFVLLIVFLFLEGDPCCSSFFALGGIRVSHRFFVLGGGSVLLIVFYFK